MKRNWAGVYITAISITALIVFFILTSGSIAWEATAKPIHTEIWENEIAEVKREVAENIVEKWETSVAEAERLEAERLEAERVIAEIESTVWTIIGNYTSNATTQNYIYYAWQQFGYYGWNTYDLDCLVTLWHRESKWNPLAHNSTSGAHGIPQSLPADKMATFGSDYWDNGYTQILWGLDYIWKRYGSPSNALSHSYGYGWY